MLSVISWAPLVILCIPNRQPQMVPSFPLFINQTLRMCSELVIAYCLMILYIEWASYIWLNFDNLFSLTRWLSFRQPYIYISSLCTFCTLEVLSTIKLRYFIYEKIWLKIVTQVYHLHHWR
jgi:hypothetical protein